MACSDRAIGHGWREVADVAFTVANHSQLETQNTGCASRNSLEFLEDSPLIALLAKPFRQKDVHYFELLAGVGSDYSLEQALYGLLCALCEDIACAQILIVYNAIPITAERIICHVDDEDTLLNSFNATIWTREIARNLASHLSRVSNAHSCVDTRSPKSTRLPQFHHSSAQKRCPTSPMKTRQPLMTITQHPNVNGDQELAFGEGGSAREEIESESSSSDHNSEKDGKWTQEFLKNQEKRRYALQQELRRAQHSPQAVLRSKPLKSLCPHHVKTVALDSDKSVEFPCSLSARDSVRHGSKGQVQLGNRGSSESAVQHPSAANHRRLMKLRKQKPSLLISANAVESSFTEVPVAAVASADQAAFIPDNEIVTVRFTFSRGRSRRAFSPGVELESELNAVAVNDTDPPDKPQRDLTLDADAGTVDNIAVEESDYYQSDADVNNNNSQNDAAASSGKAVETDSSHTSTSECGDSPLNKKQPIQQYQQILKLSYKPSPSPDVEHTQSDNEEEEGGYDGDNFADDPLPSTRATGWQHDKLEASGYASEFEDEVHGNVPDAAPTENKCNTVDAVSTDNQEQDSDDEEYSRDDFERSSISSITSSGRRRKNQSLLDVAASLGQRTPDCSQTSGDGVSTRSRQLDFGSVDHGNVDDEQGDQDEAGSPQGSEEVQEVQEEQAEEENQVQEAVATARPRRGRRGTVFWSADEEEFLRRGVEKYGIGKWKKILIDGKDVFSSHRTNVDLKVQTNGTAEVEREVQPREVREAASSERTAPRPRRSAAPKTKTSATKKTANVEIGGEEESVDPDGFTVNDSELSGPVTLKFAMISLRYVYDRSIYRITSDFFSVVCCSSLKSL
ncbi:Homeodomain-like [Phytophthora cactorum]|nr:Homeodomain-like [Phytophthora cactorum]